MHHFQRGNDPSRGGERFRTVEHDQVEALLCDALEDVVQRGNRTDLEAVPADQERRQRPEALVL